METAPVHAAAARALSDQGNHAISYLRQVAAAEPTLESLGRLAGSVASEMQIFLVETDGTQSFAMGTSELAIAYLLAAARHLPIVASLNNATKWNDEESMAAHTLRDVLQVRTHFSS
jgi:phosphoglycerate dehydrogenase-like enzyme